MADDTTEPENTEPAMVPSSRLREETRLKNDARKALAAAEERIAAIEAQAKRAADLEGQLKSLQSAWETERAAWAAGLTDPEGLEIARTVHGKIKDAPPFADWLKDAGKQHKALSAYFAQPPAKLDATETVTGTPPAKPARASAAAAEASGSPVYTTEQIRAMRDAAVAERQRGVVDGPAQKAWNDARPHMLRSA